MQLSSTLLALASLTTVVTAGVVNLDSRQPPIVYLLICTEPNTGSGSCMPVGSTVPGTCINFATELPQFENSISSFVGTSNSATCTLFEDQGCAGASLVAQVGVTTNLPTEHPALDNALSSYRCVLN